MAPNEPDNLNEQLSAYLDNELSPYERAEFEARLERDPDLRDELDALRDISDQMRSMPRADAPPSILAELTGRLERAELLGDILEEDDLPRRKSRWWGPILTTAALLAAAVGAGLYIREEMQSKPDPTTQLALASPTPAPGFDDLSHKLRNALNTADASRPSANSSDNNSLTSLGGPSPAPNEGLDWLKSLAAADSESAQADGDARAKSRPAQDHSVSEGSPLSSDDRLAFEFPDAILQATRSALKDAESAAPGDLARTDTQATLEHKLMAGESLTSATYSHQFEVEPLRLDIASNSDAERQIIEALVDASTSGIAPTDAESPASLRNSAVFAGSPWINFRPDTAEEEQWLLRLPANRVEPLIASIGSLAPQSTVALNLGGMEAQGAPDATALASLLGGDNGDYRIQMAEVFARALVDAMAPARTPERTADEESSGGTSGFAARTPTPGSGDAYHGPASGSTGDGERINASRGADASPAASGSRTKSERVGSSSSPAPSKTPDSEDEAYQRHLEKMLAELDAATTGMEAAPDSEAPQVESPMVTLIVRLHSTQD